MRKKKGDTNNTSSFSNQRLITKKSDFKLFIFGETLIIDNFP